MKVKVVQRTPVIVAYQRHIGPYGREIGEFWQRIVYPWVAANDLLGRARYGISLDDPGVTEPEKCRYDAGVEVSAAQPAPNGALVATLPGGRYAMTAFHGSSDQIGALWQALLRDWLPQSGMQLDARPFFEYYPIDARYDTARGLFSCELAVPVAPL